MDRTLSLLVKFAALDRLSPAMRTMTGGAKRAGKDLAAAKKEVLALERAAAKVDGLKTLSAQADKTFHEIDEGRRRVRELQLAIASGVGPTAKFTRSLGAAERNVAKLTAKSGEQSDRLRDLRDELANAGVDVGHLTREENRLADAVASANKRLDQQRERSERVAAADRRLARATAIGGKIRNGGAMLAAGGAAATAGLGLAARPAIAFNSSMADVTKVVDGTAAQIKHLENGILSLSRRVPIEPGGIAAIVAAGAQAGVARGELLPFADDAAKMGVAFDIAADEAGTTMAAWRNAFAMPQSEIRKLADQVNYLGNTAGAKASVITDIVTRIGPLGKVGGLAAAQIAAMGATLAGMGIDGDVAATGIKNTMLALTKGEAATKAQSAAMGQLGLNTTDVAKRMQRDAAGTIMDVMKRIGSLSADRQSGIMTDLFGSESIAAIAPMLTQLPTLATNFDRVGDASKYAGSMQAEFDGQAGTTANRIQLMNNRVDVLKIRLGNHLLPIIERTANKVGNLADRVAAWSERNPQLAGGLVKIVTVLAVAATACGTMGVAIGTVLPWIVRGAGFFLRFGRSVFMVVRIAIWLATVLAGLIGLPATLAIAFVGAAILIYKNWAKVKALFGSVVDLGRRAVAYVTGGSAGSAPAKAPAVRAVKPVRAARGGTQVSMTVNQRPGEDGERLARRVADHIQRSDAKRSASSYEDA